MKVEFVTKTTAWTRPPAYPAPPLKDDFNAVAEDNADMFKPETTSIAMKETEHPSDSDPNNHFTAYGLDGNGNVIETKHLEKDKASCSSTQGGQAGQQSSPTS